MKKITLVEEKQVHGLFGKKTVKEEKTYKVDDKTYRKMKKELDRKNKSKPISLDELIMLDLIDGE